VAKKGRKRGAKRKTRRKAASKRKTRRKTNKRKSSSKPRRKSTAGKRKSRSRARSGISSITGNKFVRGAALGLGFGALASMLASRFAPGQATLISAGAGFLGGPVGGIANLLLQGGLGIFGGGGGSPGTSDSDSTI